MSPAEEDALVLNAAEVVEKASSTFAYPSAAIEAAIRVAVRAAVAHERERCAKVCLELMKVEPGFVQTFGNAATGYQCAAAIRRGE